MFHDLFAVLMHNFFGFPKSSLGAVLEGSGFQMETDARKIALSQWLNHHREQAEEFSDDLRSLNDCVYPRESQSREKMYVARVSQVPNI